MSRFLLVRHGNTEANSAERFWGSTDVKLGPDGIEAAEKLRDHLAVDHIDMVYSSGLSRARATAEIIAAPHKLPVNICPELREIGFGKIEGLKFNEIEKLYPDVVKQWLEKNPLLQYPDGESLGMLDVRVKSFVELLSDVRPDSSYLIVAHSGVLRTLICYLLGADLTHRWDFNLQLASLSIIEGYPPKGVLVSLNDIAHLTEIKDA